MSRTFLVIAAVALPTTSFAEGFGHVTGRIVFDGERPRATVAARNAPVLCVPGGVVVDDSLVVGEMGGLANVFVFLRSAPATIHPDLAKPPTEAVRFEQEGCVFRPRCLVVRAGQPVEVESLDPVPHSLLTFPIRNVAENFVLPAAPSRAERVTLPRGEVMPIPVKCGFYPWMQAQWLVVDHPYATLTAADGTFTLRNLPAGRHQLRVWHERAGYLEREWTVEVRAGTTTKLPPLVRGAKDFE